jgi:hypothetical protein
MLSSAYFVRLSRAFAPTLLRTSVVGTSSFAGIQPHWRQAGPSSQLYMSTETAPTNSTNGVAGTSASAPSNIILKRVKTVDVKTASEETVAIKGWVRTVRKQKTLAFVEVNDGSSLSGIQCVLPFDDIDESTKSGMFGIAKVVTAIACSFSCFLS